MFEKCSVVENDISNIARTIWTMIDSVIFSNRPDGELEKANTLFLTYLSPEIERLPFH
jgi:CRISPR/Cas system type I-B associated protein Csh2 (Cas7 group RAMP superfamily)